MEDQFAALHENPDIIIATPGRLMHVAVEMKLKLQSVEYVVFDEADRLFEMGFAEHLKEIISRLPESRQTVLFSATLPKLLVEFARAGKPLDLVIGLTEPVLIRLDVESKLSEQLKVGELAQSLQGDAQGVDCTHVYSSLDQTARKINIGKFTHGKCSVLIVTDLAARGIDIPLLDNVINYSFPAKPKLFLHRVGRVARAGRSGTAYSFVAPDETPYVFDLHLFLGRPLVFASPHEKPTDRDGMFGRVPQNIIDDEESLLQTDHERSLDLQNLRRVADNAQKQYQKSRPAPSAESIKRTIFEINATNKTLASDVMRAKRIRDRQLIDRHQRKQQERLSLVAAAATKASAPPPDTQEVLEEGEEQIQEVFSNVVGRKQKQHPARKGTEQQKQPLSTQQDEEFYIPYRPKDFDSERAVLDLMGDENENMNKNKKLLKWDRKRKRFVGQTGQEDKKKIRTESGAYISSSYKRNLYEKWKKRNKIDEQDSDSEAEGERRAGKKWKGRGARPTSSPHGSRGPQQGKVRSELKTKQQIFKERRKKAKQRFLQSGGLKRLKSRNRQHLQELRRSAFGRGTAKKGKLRKRM
ncbi:hypothetical protein JD844_014953 [Phrynosoma platyrhinos]|uniref:RNA helicase n=1 Tax=Phrynosoma platyrhinos TaxID=52577 RepID=A0ABQ7T7Q0_PHRPL|nr:hypothetical protein JD844_014953 [Phrynosoma platyrhinos]